MRKFQFTPVVRRATCEFPCRNPHCHRFNSRPSCDGRRRNMSVGYRVKVSIHARRATGDRRGLRRWTPSGCFNSRPSCDGRLPSRRFPSRAMGFNSRPSCDGRRYNAQNRRSVCSFNSRPSCDGRRDRCRARCARPSVSIHARRATGDDTKITCVKWCEFQFTPVVRRATASSWRRTRRCCFNSRPSCDGRPNAKTRTCYSNRFQFTPVVRRATYG